MNTTMLTFGPIPSRRLGHSLGINNIPPKVCSYACVYCQVGHTTQMLAERQAFYQPQEIYSAVVNRLDKLRAAGEPVDYLSFVPDGEPTLDINMGKAIELLKPLGIKIAVITNASLIWRQDVRHELALADWVSLKIDSLDEEHWHQVDRPQKKVQLSDIKSGMLEFAAQYRGELVTETMLVRGMNDSTRNAEMISEFLCRLDPSWAYLLVPTRPPAETGVFPPDEQTLTRFYHALSEKFERVAYQISYEGNAFAATGSVEEDLISITSVHPMREDAVREYLKKCNSDWRTVEKLLHEGFLLATEYNGERYYVRRLNGRRKKSASRS